MASKWAWRTTSRAAGSPSESFGEAGCALGVEVEGGLGAGEVAEGLRAPHLQRLVGADGSLGGGVVGEATVEVEHVGDVELGLHPHRAGEVHVIVVDGRVAGVDVEVAVLRIRSRIDVGEVVAPDGLGDEPVQLRGTDPTSHGSDLGIHEAPQLPRQRRSGVDGDLRDHPRHAGTRPMWT